MLNEKQIAGILLSVQETLKGSGMSKDKKHYDCKWGEAYHEACEFAEEVRVHSVRGVFPEKLMRAKAPNETGEELKYRRESFESITVPYFQRAESSLNRIWAEQNYKIIWPDTEDIKDYFLEDFPVYGNIVSFFQSVVSKKKVRDPNAVLAVDFDLPVKETAEGELVIDQAEIIDTYASLYDACDVLMFELGDYALFMVHDEKSLVDYGGGKPKAMGWVMYLYDDTNIYRIEQTGKYQDFNFKYAVYYEHGLEYLPCWKLKGIPHSIYADNPVYESYFSGALPHLNSALKLNSTLDCSIAKVAYPIRTYYDKKCGATGCNNGQVYDGKGKSKQCGTCKGTGRIRFSPNSDLIMNEPDRLDADNKIPFPAIAFVSPPSEILTFNKDYIKENIIAAFTFINIDVSNRAQSNGTEQTATEIRIDRDEFYTFLLTFSNECFTLLSDFMDAAATIRYNSEINIEVSPPKVFDLTTPTELTDELAKPGLPAIARKALKSEYLTRRFTQNGALVKVDEIVDLVDPYSDKVTQDMVVLKTSGVIKLWQFILHEEILSYIADEINKDPEFLSKDIEAIKTVLIERAKAQEALVAPVAQSAEDIQAAMAKDDVTPWAVGDTVKIKPGNEKLPIHKDASFKISVINSDKTVVLTLEGKEVNGYTEDDLV